MSHTKGELEIKIKKGNRWFVQLQLNEKSIATITNLNFEAAVAYAERLVKCWNEHDKLIKQRDDLLAACKRCKKIAIETYGNTSWNANYSDMETAIAEAEKD